MSANVSARVRCDQHDCQRDPIDTSTNPGDQPSVHRGIKVRSQVAGVPDEQLDRVVIPNERPQRHHDLTRHVERHP